MPNPLFNMFGGLPQMGQPNQNGPFSNMIDFMNQLNNFRSNFQGDPRQKVQELLNNGQMSQSQFQQLSQMAQNVCQMMGPRFR